MTNSSEPAPEESPAPAPAPGSHFRFTLIHAAMLLLAFTALRVALALAFRPGTSAADGDYLRCFLTGVARDAAVALAFTLPVLAGFALWPRRWFTTRWGRRVWLGYYGFAWVLFAFLIAAEFFFFDEFKSRFNTVAIDYLLYPHEVFVNIWDAYPVPAVLGGCAVVALAAGFVASRLTRDIWTAPARRLDDWRRLGGAVVLLALMAGALRFVPARFSSERLVNELANNGVLSVLHAAWSRNLDYAAFYPTMSRKEAFGHSRWLLTEPGANFTGAADTLTRRIPGDNTKPRHNVVLLLEESLGSEFFGSLGRTNGTLTPRLDQLSEEGLFFVNMYATGNRTVRGFEGVLSSFPPLPGDSIVKRDRSDHVETIARVLQRDGYRTMFLYGGRGLFDGMRSFATRNGYERFIEQKDFAKPTFTTIWGVCNEDLYQRTLEECRAFDQRGEPFFATVLSVSNHKPYTYPPGRIAENPLRRKRNHAVKYTDWSLGQFFDAAKRERFWTNTLFVVIADHGARVYGSQSIPIHSYEIPFLVLGPAAVKSPARVLRSGSQLDVAPTLLGLLGRPYDSTFFGRDLLTHPEKPGRALLNHNRDIGIASGEHLVVFGLNKKVEYYAGNPKTEALALVAKPDGTHRELERDAVALFQAADELYMNRRYRIQEPTRPPAVARNETGHRAE